jgi:EAL domain-containing protein (putative c-di-GMP-specific phosphodiesterase class I)
VAEGVESRAQLLNLRRIGIQRAQGYLFAKPVDARRMLALLDNGGFEALVSGLPNLNARNEARQ